MVANSGENTTNKHFLCLPRCFQKLLAARAKMLAVRGKNLMEIIETHGEYFRISLYSR